MLRGFLTFCSLLPLVHCTRQSSHSYAQILAESRSVPKVIYDALREAGALVKTKLDTLQEANRLAEQRQADSSAKIDEKMKAMKAMQTKTEQVSATAKATRELMLQADAAAAKHSKAGDEHRRSMAAFGKASEDLEDMAKKVTLAEQKLRDIVADSKRELGDLQSQWDKMSQEKEQAEAEMMELKTQAMSAGKLKTGVQEEQAKVERDMQLAQQELQGIHRALETAVSAATVAEAQEAMAVNEAREADGRVHVAKKTREYLMKIRRAVQAYYDSINELESAVDGKANLQLKDVPEAKTVLEKYNLMLSAFGDLHAYDAKVYQKVTAAKEEVKKNAFAQLRFICDLLGISTSEDGHCLAGLWTTFGMSKLPFPDEVLEAPGAPQEAPEEDEDDDDIDLTPQVSPEEDEDEDIDMAPEKDAPTRRTAEETLKPEPLPEPALVPEVSPAKNRKRKRVSYEPLADLPLPAPKRFKRSAPEPEEPPLVPEVPKVSPAKNLKRKRVTDEPLADLPLPAPKRFKRSAPEPEEPSLVPEVPKVSPAKNLKRKRVSDEPLADLPLPAPKRFKRSALEPEEPPLVPEVPKVAEKNLKRSKPEYDPLAHRRVTDEPLRDLPLPVPKSMEMPAPTSKLPALECGGARVHWASCSKRDGCRYVKKADASRCGVSQHGCYNESQLPSECQLSLAPAPPSGCGGGAVHFASCYKKSGCRYVKKEDVTRCGVSLYGCYAVKELPLACQPKVRGVRVRLS